MRRVALFVLIGASASRASRQTVRRLRRCSSVSWSETYLSDRQTRTASRVRGTCVMLMGHMWQRITCCVRSSMPK